MIIQRFASTTTDPAARGREVGQAFAPQIADSLEGYWRLFDAKGVDRDLATRHAAAMLDAVAAWSPSLAAELAGLADGAGITPVDAALMNGRTEIAALAPPSGHGECSTGVHLPVDGSAPRTLQTWDWYLHLAAEALVWTYVTDAGRQVSGFTEFGILGKVGVNDAGVGSHINMLNHVSDGWDGDPARVGIPIHLIARRIHDEARDLDDAIELVRSTRVTASSAITIAAASPARAVMLEISPAGVAEIVAEPGATLLHTNHFLDPALAAGEINPDMRDTEERLAALENRVAAIALEDPRARGIELVDGLPGGGPVCVYELDEAVPELGWETKATLSLDLEGRTLRAHAGNPATLSERGSVF